MRARTSRSLRIVLPVLIVASLLIVLAVARFRTRASEPTASRRGETASSHSSEASAREFPSEPANFVGSQACAGCHTAQHADWSRSQHALAMQHANAESVLGNFDDAQLVYAGNVHRFEQKEGKYWVTTDGRDGKLAPFQVLYTFGIEPLQQYLVEAPGGRLQVLPFAWDSRPKEAGGQRWYHLYPEESVKAGDPLHWSAPSQNWNHMCAECHSTNVYKGYDATSDRFATSWSELSVGCEACHGGGERHLAWTETRTSDPRKGFSVRFDERHQGVPKVLPSGTLMRAKAASSGTESATCAPCHSRHESLAQPFRHGAPLLDNIQVALLTEPFYGPDGVMDDEVFTYGSFIQSKMAAAGVTCSDCHNPHSGRLYAEGNAVCTQCHDRARFDVPQHHHHAARSEGGVRCLDCHMPARTYMGVDVRHDHGFRVPRPDLAERSGAADACTDCHAGRSHAWAAKAIEDWLGRPARSFQTYTEAFARARTRDTGVADELRALALDKSVPNIARATALELLSIAPLGESLGVLRVALGDADPVLRHAALGAFRARAPLELRRSIALLTPRLTDPVRGVRIQAARLLAGLGPELPSGAARDFERALDEYIATQSLHADRPEAQNNLGLVLSRTGSAERAEQAFTSALRIEPSYVPTYVNLADLYRALGRNDEGLALLERGVARVPDNAELLHSLGLVLVRLGQKAQALEPLRRAALLAPSNQRFQYVYEVALADSSKTGVPRPHETR